MIKSEEDSSEESESSCESDIFEEEKFCSMSRKANSFAEYFSLGAFEHKLLLASNDINDEVRHGYDIVSDFVQRKNDFLFHLKCKTKSIAKRNIPDDFRTFEAQIEKTRKETCIRVPSYIPLYMEIAKREPDEEFFGTYNWYYTGGCLQNLNINEKHYLVYVGGKSRDNLCVAPLKHDQLWCIDKTSVRNVTAFPGKEIFQIVVLEKPTRNFIGIRQRDSCSMYSYGKDETITELFNVGSSVPIASFDISSVYEELCSINFKQALSFWDIHRKEEPTTVYFPGDNSQYDKWYNLSYAADGSVVALAGRKSIKWMDRRSSNVQNSTTLAHFKGIRDDEQISLHFRSEQSPYLTYVGTDKNLLVLDIRSPVSAVHRWPHRLSSPPLYSNVISFSDGNEIACFGNHNPGNVVLAFSGNSEIYPLVEMPLRMDTLHKLQACGLFLDPSIKPRMMSGLTGLTSVKSNNFRDVALLTQTATSDIFSQALLDSSTDMRLCGFRDLITSSEILNASERCNMTKLYNNLSNENLKLNRDHSDHNLKQAWQISKHELIQFKDVLSPIILEEWDVDYVQCEKQAITSDQKVSAWLGTNNFEYLSMSFSEERDPLLEEV